MLLNRRQCIIFFLYTFFSFFFWNAEAIEPELETDFCAVSSGSITSVKNQTYIMGGWWLWANGLANYNGPNDYYQAIDTSKPFNVSEVDKYAPAQPLPSNMPRLSHAALWQTDDDHLNYMMGIHEVPEKARQVSRQQGIFSNDEKWRFSIKSGKWEKDSRDLQLNNFTIGAKAEGEIDFNVGIRARAWVPDLKKGYMMSGLILKHNRSEVKNAVSVGTQNGFLVYDHATNSWSNETSPRPDTEENAMVHLKTAEDNLLLSLGGFGGRKGGFLVTHSMRELDIYSTKKKVWYRHTIPESETAPNPRGAFCATLVSAEGGKSHQLYIFGGSSAPRTQHTEPRAADPSVWALDIPSFKWVDVTPTTLTNAPSPGRRHDPICASIGGSQVLVTGGRVLDSPTSGTPTCDSWGENFFLFDLNSLQYKEEFVPYQPYKVAPRILDIARGKSKPDNGYQDKGLEELMKFDTSKEPSEKAPGDDNDGKVEGAVKSQSGVNRIAVAGGVIGGLSTITGVVILTVILHRRRKLQRAPKRTLYEPPPNYPLELPPPPGQPTQVPHLPKPQPVLFNPPELQDNATWEPSSVTPDSAAGLLPQYYCYYLQQRAAELYQPGPQTFLELPVSTLRPKN